MVLHLMIITSTHFINLAERNKFITWRRSRKLIKENGVKAEAIVEKDKFNKRFSKYINRDWIDLNLASS